MISKEKKAAIMKEYARTDAGRRRADDEPYQFLPEKETERKKSV